MIVISHHCVKGWISFCASGLFDPEAKVCRMETECRSIRKNELCDCFRCIWRFDSRDCLAFEKRLKFFKCVVIICHCYSFSLEKDYEVRVSYQLLVLQQPSVLYSNSAHR